MVGLSVMWVTVTVSLLGSPFCLWELGKGSSSLNHPLNHCPVHQSYSTLRVGHQCDLLVFPVLGLPWCLMWTGRWSFWGFVMVFAGYACPGSTVISGETPVWWGSMMWCVLVVMLCARASVHDVLQHEDQWKDLEWLLWESLWMLLLYLGLWEWDRDLLNLCLSLWSW